MLAGDGIRVSCAAKRPFNTFTFFRNQITFGAIVFSVFAAGLLSPPLVSSHASSQLPPVSFLLLCSHTSAGEYGVRQAAVIRLRVEEKEERKEQDRYERTGTRDQQSFHLIQVTEKCLFHDCLTILHMVCLLCAGKERKEGEQAGRHNRQSSRR